MSLQQMTDEQQRFEEDQVNTDLCAAMALAFSEIDVALKSSSNPHFKSKYADLTAVIDSIKPALIKHGLFFVQTPHETEAGGITLETLLFHKSGGSMSLGKLFVPATKSDAQGYGSALTYARRYGLVTAFGVPQADDDGNAASRPQQQRLEPPPIAKIPAKRRDFLIEQFRHTGSMEDLAELWKDITPDERAAMADAKDFAKQRLMEAA